MLNLYRLPGRSIRMNRNDILRKPRRLPMRLADHAAFHFRRDFFATSFFSAFFGAAFFRLGFGGICFGSTCRSPATRSSNDNAMLDLSRSPEDG